MKKASVTPIFKPGESTETINYRPKSVLSLFAKIIEECLHNRVMAFFEQYCILSNKQWGFKKGKSCSDAITFLIENTYKSLNEKKIGDNTIH